MPKSSSKDKRKKEATKMHRRWNDKEHCYEERKAGSKDKYVLVDRKDEPQEEEELTQYRFNTVYHRLSQTNYRSRVISLAELEVEKQAGTFNADLQLVSVKPKDRKKHERLISLRKLESGHKKHKADLVVKKTEDWNVVEYEIVLREPNSFRPNNLYETYFYKELWPYSKDNVAMFLELYRSKLKEAGLWEKHGWKEKLPERPSKKTYIPASIDDFIEWLTEKEGDE